MSARGFAVLALALAATGGAGAARAAQEFRAPAPTVRTLANGLRVAVFEDHRLPVVQIQVLIPAGSAADPAGGYGVAGLTAEMLRLGTSSRSAQAFGDAVGRLGGTVSANASRDFSTVSGAFLARDFRAGLELVADAVINPVFPDDALAGARLQSLQAIVALQRSPSLLADETLWSAVFGRAPYGHSPLGDLGSVRDVTRESLRAFHGDYYRPAGAVLAIAGDVDAARALAAAQDRFGHWIGHANPVPKAPAPDLAAPTEVRIVDRPGDAPVEIRLGGTCPARSASDRLAAEVAMDRLGGGPGSRLARATGGGWLGTPRAAFTSLRDGGLFSVSALAPVDSVAAAIGRLSEIVATFVSHPPTEAELAPARRRLHDAWPMRFETPGQVLAQWMAADFYGLPEGSITGDRTRLETLDSVSVAAAVRRWIRPDHRVIVVVGPADRLRAALAPFGRVEVVAPRKPAAKAEPGPIVNATPEQVRHGRRLIAQAVAAHGGLTRLREVHDSTVEADVMLDNGQVKIQGDLEQIRKEPEKMVYRTRLSGVESRQVLSGARAWATAGGDTTHVLEQDSLAVRALRSGFASDIVHLLLAAADTSNAVVYRDTDRIQNRKVDVVEVDGATTGRRRLFLDAENHRLLGFDQVESSVGGRSHTARRLYGDFQTVGGVLWPYHEERQIDGRTVMTLAVTRLAINSGVSDRLFEHPRKAARGAPSGR